jgi:hypothetical protein
MTLSFMNLDLRLPLSVDYTFHKKEGSNPAAVDIYDICIGVPSELTSIADIIPDQTYDDLCERVLAIHLQENPNV